VHSHTAPAVLPAAAAATPTLRVLQTDFLLNPSTTSNAASRLQVRAFYASSASRAPPNPAGAGHQSPPRWQPQALPQPLQAPQQSQQPQSTSPYSPGKTCRPLSAQTVAHTPWQMPAGNSFQAHAAVRTGHATLPPPAAVGQAPAQEAAVLAGNAHAGGEAAALHSKLPDHILERKSSQCGKVRAITIRGTCLPMRAPHDA
jgi:hypothetical protein